MHARQKSGSKIENNPEGKRQLAVDEGGHIIIEDFLAVAKRDAHLLDQLGLIVDNVIAIAAGEHPRSGPKEHPASAKGGERFLKHGPKIRFGGVIGYPRI